MLTNAWMLSFGLSLMLAGPSFAEIREPEEWPDAPTLEVAQAQEQARLEAAAGSQPGAIVTTAGALLNFDAQGRLEDPPSRRAAAIRIDTWAGYFPRHPDIKLGLGLVLCDGPHAPRASLQLGVGVVGVGLGWKVIPIIDLAVGIGCLWSVEFDDLEPSIYFSFAAW
jgi:hypothetical protein